MTTKNYVTTNADQMATIYQRVKEMADDLVNGGKWPCFYQRKQGDDGKDAVGGTGRPACIIMYAQLGEAAFPEMCATCQLLYRVQEVEREMMRQVRVQQMWEAGRA